MFMIRTFRLFLSVLGHEIKIETEVNVYSVSVRRVLQDIIIYL